MGVAHAVLATHG